MEGFAARLWGTVHQRFRRWRDNGIWDKILEALIDDPDYEWLMIDASHCKVHLPGFQAATPINLPIDKIPPINMAPAHKGRAEHSATHGSRPRK